MSAGKFPDDENGDVLRQFQANGDDLSIAREIDFSVVFPDELSARRFATTYRERGFRIECEETNTTEGLPWDVVISRPMVPTHAGITAFEDELAAAAAPLGGRNDGWGCFEQKGTHAGEDVRADE